MAGAENYVLLSGETTECGLKVKVHAGAPHRTHSLSLPWSQAARTMLYG